MLKKISLIIILATSLTWGATISAVSPSEANQGAAAVFTGVSNKDLTSPEKFVGVVIQGAIAILGILLIIMIVWAGMSWMTAHDDAAKVARAKGVIMAAIIGLILAISGYAIISFVLQQLNISSNTSSTTQNSNVENNKSDYQTCLDNCYSDCGSDCNCTEQCLQNIEIGVTDNTTEVQTTAPTTITPASKSCTENCLAIGYSSSYCSSYCDATDVDGVAKCVNYCHNDASLNLIQRTLCADRCYDSPSTGETITLCSDSCLEVKSADYCDVYCPCLFNHDERTCANKAERETKD